MLVAAYSPFERCLKHLDAYYNSTILYVTNSKLLLLLVSACGDLPRAVKTTPAMDHLTMSKKKAMQTGRSLATNSAANDVSRIDQLQDRDGQPLESKRYFCSSNPDQDLPAEFVCAVVELGRSLDLPVWLLVQGGRGELDQIGEKAKRILFDSRRTGLRRDQPVALLIDSLGGSAQCAYEIASLLRKHCGGFVAVIPRRAKSAATLLSLGSDEILLGEYGELGPLDVQIVDPDREERISGLDEVQSLERLQAFALTAFDQAMFLLVKRTGMKVSTLMPHVTRFVSAVTQSLFQGPDAVRYTQMSRFLKVGEEYARRLLRKKYGEEQANAIARRLVEDYPVHSFVIDREEGERVGLAFKKPTDNQIRIMDRISEELPKLTAIGQIIERRSP